MLRDTEFVNINMGRITEQELRNTVREVKRLWMYVDNVMPRAEIKATKDAAGQYHIYINMRGLKYLMLFCSKIEPNDLAALKPQNRPENQMPPDFLATD